MDETTKIEKLLMFVNKILKKRLHSTDLNDLEKLQVKMSIYNMFEKHHDSEELYYELLDYLEAEGLEGFMGDVDEYYISINK